MSVTNHQQNQEIVYLLARSNFLSYYKYWLLSLFLIISSSFFLYPLWLNGWWGITFDVILFIVGLIIFFRGYFVWYFSYWKITNRGIIDSFQKGFLKQEKTQINYSDIDSVYVKKQGLLQNIIKAGDVFIKIKNNQTKLKLPICRNYLQLISLINERREEYLNSLSNLREKKAQLLLAKIRIKLGEEKFKELIFN